jgi:hypothetical protein
MALFDTAGNIVNSAAIEIGLSSVSNVYTSTDANFIQLRTLLESLGSELLHERQWTHLISEYTFPTVQGISTYALPADFHNMIDQTWWNRTNRLPVGGPLSAQEWQYLKARLVGVVFTVLFRPLQGNLIIYPDTNTPGGYTIAFEYLTNNWVVTSGGAATDTPTADTDTIRFDKLLLRRGLKLAFLKAKGFDTTAAQREYDITLEQIKSFDAPSPILSLNGALRNQEFDWLA